MKTRTSDEKNNLDKKTASGLLCVYFANIYIQSIDEL